VTDRDFEQATLRKVTWRLIPFLFVLYVVCFLDRVNVGFAALRMNHDLGLSDAAYGFGAGVFFIGYALFEVPSNLLLARYGARRWIARIMITWGVLAAAMMFTRGPLSFYALRFLVGLAEAGFFPGVIFYLSEWFPARERARAIARFMTAIPISGLIGGPISGALLGLDGLHGLHGWQWLFLLEGIPSALLGLAVLRFLPDRPQDARWLAPAEQAWLAGRLSEERAQLEQRHGLSVLQALRNGTVWKLALLVFFGVGLGQYALALWLPQIVRSFGGMSDAMVGVVAAVPYLFAAVAMVLVGISSDRTGERCLHMAGSVLAAAIGFVASAYLESPALIVLALSLAAAGLWSFHGPFWTLPSQFLTGSAAAGGIAMINTVSAMSGFVGPYAIGLLKGASGDFRSGFLVLALASTAGAVMAMRLRRAPRLAADGAASPPAGSYAATQPS
jgi:ACS family tartrate transporter-like MFS transporter